MIGICLGLAGVIWAQIPEGPFTLAWQHTVQKVRWEEDYRIQGRRLLLETARVQGTGAGMEIPDGAYFARGHWQYHPRLSLGVLRLARTPEAGDYQLCLASVCTSMTDWVGPPSQEAPAIELWVCNLG